MRQKKIYLSGKIAGLDEKTYKENFSRAEKRVREIINDNYAIIVNPAMLPPVHMSWADYLIRDLMLLKDCDMIFMLPGWEESKGAITERAFATGAGIEIKYL